MYPERLHSDLDLIELVAGLFQFQSVEIHFGLRLPTAVLEGLGLVTGLAQCLVSQCVSTEGQNNGSTLPRHHHLHA